MNKVIMTKEECEQVRALASQLIRPNIKFPNPMFLCNEFKFILLESWSIFDENTFNDFQEFLGQSGDNEFYIVPDDILEVDSGDYEIRINNYGKNKIEPWPILKIKAGTDYSTYEHVRDDYFTRVRETYLFGDSLKWLIFNHADWDLMLFGFTPKLETTIKEIYWNHEDHIVDFKRLFDFIDAAIRPDRKKEVQKILLKEYAEVLKPASTVGDSRNKDRLCDQ